MHSRKPISSFSRRLPVGVKMLARKRMWAVFPRTHPVAQSARAPLLCQERTEWAMAEFGGSVQLGAQRRCDRSRTGLGIGPQFTGLMFSFEWCTNSGTLSHECKSKAIASQVLSL